MTEFWLVAAVASNNVIGNGNALPWRIPEDLARFKKLTLGHTLVMGRKTFDSIGRPLPGRTTVVITRRDDFAVPGVLVAHGREEAIALAEGSPVFVVGGAEIYRLFLPIASKLILTRVEGVFEGDTYFPPFDPREWRLVASEPSTPGAAAPAFAVDVYERGEQPPRRG
jgi:dihydrofolate reductase